MSIALICAMRRSTTQIAVYLSVPGDMLDLGLPEQTEQAELFSDTMSCVCWVLGTDRLMVSNDSHSVNTRAYGTELRRQIIKVHSCLCVVFLSQ